MKINYQSIEHNLDNIAPFVGAVLTLGTGESKSANGLIEHIISKKNKGVVFRGDFGNQTIELLNIISTLSKRGLDIMIDTNFRTANELYHQIGLECAKANALYDAYESMMETVGDTRPYEYLGSVILDSYNERTYYIRTCTGDLNIIRLEDENDN